MAILAECAVCHRKQSAKNRLCSCGEDLVRLKRSKKIKYWIAYRVNGKQRRECVGYSIEEARDAEGKRRSQKRENRIFDIMPEAKMTFRELAEWYLELPKVEGGKDLWRKKITLNNFNQVFGNMVVRDLKPTDLENYQARRQAANRSSATIDHEIGDAQTMVNKAFKDGKVSGDTLRAFKNVDRLLKPGDNARDRVLSVEEYVKLVRHARVHIKPIIKTAYYTGMRLGEILKLRWSCVDLKGRFIRLKAEDTKTGKSRNIPIPEELYVLLRNLPNRLQGAGEEDPHVFLYKNGPIKTAIRTGIKTACKKAGIPYGRFVKDGFVFHDIRGSAKTNMMNAGVDKVLRDKILGHSLEGMDKHYMRASENDLRRGMDRYMEWLRKSMSSVDQTVDQAAKANP